MVSRSAAAVLQVSILVPLRNWRARRCVIPAPASPNLASSRARNILFLSKLSICLLESAESIYNPAITVVCCILCHAADVCAQTRSATLPSCFLADNASPVLNERIACQSILRRNKISVCDHEAYKRKGNHINRYFISMEKYVVTIFLLKTKFSNVSAARTR